ncbi:YbaB/EbfC family nucleoid-associated protein [uncultured Cyclobacterium sp.]|uniref:YbaB/EbfC family nucleoid-associated protein n=1 Tax=uncultured Cyclobacterium sp. TaxID=453820 RepID=UPI0030EDF8B2|tara:strand:- start:7391 stop:7723 length:333 start_codon:yes stop_codon:yes gene_type:complete
MFDMMNIMNKVKDAQAKIKATQAELVHLRAEGEVGAGMVKVVVNGERRVLDMEIDPSLINEKDKDMMKDLIVGATNKALENIDVKIKEKMGNATAGMMPNIPGMDFGNMV